MEQIKLDQLHKIMLEEFKAFHKLCVKHNIYYMANGGTCLGAIREKGFIPWDDDVDIMMFRRDYDKFVEIAKKEINDFGCPYKLYLNDENGVRGYYISTDINNDDILGKATVSIGLLVFDKLPNSKLLQKIMRFRLLSCRAMISKKRGKISFAKKIYINLMEFIGKLKGFKNVQKLHDKIATKYNKNESFKYYISTQDAYNVFLNKNYPEKYLMDRIIVKFEGTDMYVPKYYDELLTYEYGNYMERPPLEEQKPSHDKF